VKGRIEFANAELDDLVIARQDGTPTYNFCVVVDDIDMRITDVIRGDDHVNNTPRQINIFHALGATPPAYAHVPTVLGEDGAKLSKRHGAMSVMEYEAQGYLPEALVNFLARIGWGHGDDEIFTREQLVQWFDLPGISAAPSRFNADKLNWVNQEHMKRLPEAELGRRLAPFLVRAGLDPASGPDPGAVAALLRDRADTLAAMADAAHYFYAAPTVAPDKLAEQVNDATRPVLEDLHAVFADIEWTRESLMTALKAAATRHALKPPPVMMAVRMLVAATTSTPAIDAVLALIGRDATRARMARGLGL
jgi:glutamyl-tRNA synthetase